MYQAPKSELAEPNRGYHRYTKVMVSIYFITSTVLFFVLVKNLLGNPMPYINSVYRYLEYLYGTTIQIATYILVLMAFIVMMNNRKWLRLLILLCIITLVMNYGLSLFVEVQESKMASGLELFPGQEWPEMPEASSNSIWRITLYYLAHITYLLSLLIVMRKTGGNSQPSMA